MYQSPPPDTAPVFPTGVVIEIMSWLPVKALLQCQLVCKDWQSVIHSNYFKHIHLDRSTNTYHWYIAQSNNNRQNNHRFFFWHGCNGLLLLIKIGIDKKYCLWNPATRRILELSDPHVDGIWFGVSFCPTNKSYKVVSFYKDGNELGCQVLTLGGQAYDNNVWRQLDFPHLCEWKNYWDMDWEGKLAIADIVGENMEVMELEDHKNARWCEQKRVIHLPFLKKKGDGNESIVIPLLAERGEIWFWLKGEKIFKFTMGTGKCTDVLEAPTLYLPLRNFTYRPSLVSFEGMVHGTKSETFGSFFKSNY